MIGLLVLYFLVGYMVVLADDLEELQAVKEPEVADKATSMRRETNTLAHFFIIRNK